MLELAPRRVRRWRAVAPVLLLPLLVLACSGSPPASDPIRLIDRFGDATVEGTPGSPEAGYPHTEWRFAEDEETPWEAKQGVDGLRTEGQTLRGRTTSPMPVLAVRPTLGVPESEALHAIEVRARVSAGSELAVRFDQGERLVLPRALGNPFGAFTTPIRAGDEMQTYVIQPPVTVAADAIGHVLLTPSNEPGADFEIESLRLVFRGEHLASIPSGVGWHGAGEIYKETIATRAPETVRFSVELPAEPSLELDLATIGAGPVTFRAEVRADGESESRRIERTVSEPAIWQPERLGLDGLGGRRAEIALSLEAEDGAVGLWGAPAVRSGALPTAVAGRDPVAPQGVILIITDTLRSDHLELHGYERQTAPTLTRLAAEGTSFSDAISQATWTKVSVPSIQTSLYPSTHTVGDIPDRLPASAATVAELYREAGYATLALTTIPFVGRMTNLHQGYETMHEGASIDDELGPKTAGELVGRLEPWLEQRGGSPFFVLLHVADPHSPFRPLEEHETVFAEPGDMDRLDELIDQVRPHIELPLMKQFGMPRRSELEAAGVDPEEFVRHELNGYDGSIRGMDDALVRLFDRIEALGLRDRVLVAVVSDHGTEFLEHDEHFHGHTVYGELNRVPMLLWGPSYVPPGRRVETMVQTIDLMPTLLELNGLAVPEAAQGRSLVPLFADGGERGWNRPAITELPANIRGERMSAMISDGWKLIRFGDSEGEPRYELYSHREDPLNLRDLAAENGEVVERLGRQLENWRSFALAARLDDQAATEQLSAEELKRLRSLGYVQ